MTTRLLSTAEAAKELDRAHNTVSRWVREGKLKPVAEGEGIRGARFFTRAEIARMKRELEKDAA